MEIFNIKKGSYSSAAQNSQILCNCQDLKQRWMWKIVSEILQETARQTKR